MELSWSDLAPVVARLLGHGPAELGEPVDLGGSSRTVVWRVAARSGSYVVKAHREEEVAGYARECSALEVLSGSGTVPDMVAHDDAALLLVMTDLGAGDHLAAALLGEDRDLAQRRLHAWVDALAALHASATPAVVAGFERSVSARGAVARGSVEEQSGMARERYAATLPEVGMQEALPDLLSALERVPSLLSEDVALSPGDACPDNNAVVGAGSSERLVLLDLEGAQLLHPAWDLAYLTVPWPSCWCAWAMPQEVVETALVRYGARQELRDALAVTTAVWSVLGPGWFLPRALHPEPDDEQRPEVPTRRAMVQHRLDVAARAVLPAELVAIPQFAARLHAALEERWGEVTLPLGPAWRATTLAP